MCWFHYTETLDKLAMGQREWHALTAAAPCRPPCRPGLPAELPPSWAFAPATEVSVRKAAPAPTVDVPKPKLREAAPAEKLFDLEEETGALPRLRASEV